MKYKALGVIGAVLLVLLTAPSTLGQTTTGVEGKPTPNAGTDIIIGRTYIWWDPSVIFAGSVTRLHAGMDVLSSSPRVRYFYSIRVVVYDPHPAINGRPVLVSHTLVGCRTHAEFRYDHMRRAWVFDSGICFAWGSNSFRIIASWRPMVPGRYMAEVTGCLHGLTTGCSSRSATLTVLWR